MISERAARFRTRTLAWGSLLIVAISLAVFGVSVETFYIAATIPWIAAWVYVMGRGVICLFPEKGQRQPNIGHVYGFSTFWPGFAAVTSETGSLRWEVLVVVGIAIGSLLTVVAWNKRRPGAELAFLIVLNSIYGFGLASSLNQDLDAEPPQTHHAQVLTKRTGRVRRRDYHYLQLGPWGPKVASAEVLVNGQSYDRISVGEIVCVDLHPGALHVPWFETKPCERLK